MSWFNRMIVGMMPAFPKRFIWIFSSRYIAGKRLEDAVRKTKALNRAGCVATIDVLGEDISTLAEAEQARDEGLAVLDAIKAEGLDANLSVKLSQLGLKLDPEVCYQNVRKLAEKAAANGNFLRIDMEDASVTDATLAVYRRLRREFPNTGAVVQAYLKRTEDDVRGLIRDGIAHLRVCKGIYIESPEIAYKNKEAIRDHFKAVVTLLFDGDGYAAIATHDKALVEWAFGEIKRRALTPDRYEFQMLLGVTEKLRGRIVANGHRLRVYVPFGEQWYRYCMRRMKENPAVAGSVMKALFIRG